MRLKLNRSCTLSNTGLAASFHTSVWVKGASKKYSATIFLPKTSFPARLEGKKRVERDKEIAEKCKFSAQYAWQRLNRDKKEIWNNISNIPMNCILNFMVLILVEQMSQPTAYIEATGCSGKFVFLNSLQPLPRLHRCKRPSKLSTQCECHSYWLVIFCTPNSSRVLARERWQTFENSWKKTQYLIYSISKNPYYELINIRE